MSASCIIAEGTMVHQSNPVRRRPGPWKIDPAFVIAMIVLFSVCTQQCTPPILGSSQTSSVGTGRYRADVWADNWFAL